MNSTCTTQLAIQQQWQYKQIQFEVQSCPGQSGKTREKNKKKSTIDLVLNLLTEVIETASGRILSSFTLLILNE